MTDIKKKVDENARSLKDEGLIALYVEECKEPYHVQRTLLSRTSKWFEGALSKMTGDQKHEIRFADTSTETLELFLFWLLEGTVACIGEGNTEDTYKPELEELSAQVGLWIFADRHLIPHLQNAVMRRLDELSTDNLIYPSLPAIRYAYLHSTPNSCLRRFMIDQVSRGIYYGPTTSQKAEGDDGYSAEEVVSLHDAPGVLEDLIGKYRTRMRADDETEAIDIDIKKWFVEEETDCKGAA